MEALYFDQLNLSEKENLVFEEGFFIGKREENDYRVLLYVLDKKYIEVWCKKQNCKVERIETLVNTEILANYISNADVAKLFLLANVGFRLN